MKFIVAQIGARRSYATPAALDDARMLERFYTDMTGNVGLGKVLAATASLALPSKRARRLAERRLPSRIRAKTVTFPGLALVHALRCAVFKQKPAAMFREALRFSNSLGRAMAECGFGNASHLYSMLGECGPLLFAAKNRGLKIVSEIYILLSTERILAEERRKFAAWEPDVPDYRAIRREISGEDILLTYSDFAICPSEAVRNDLVENFGFVRERTAIVPYGMNPDLLSIRNEPIRGRVLFAGTADLRKGIHYLATAADKILARGLRYEFRIAGDVRPDIARQHACRHLNFLGRVPRAEMSNEFASADVFVLPSLAEGSAEATYEALASGVPVVTTSEAGSVARNGIEGRIVASRDPETLANAIAEIVEDREKREQMALAARQRARGFTWERYGEGLVAALKSFAETPGVLECA
jgi:glycosyltransferase involved in cell wall biosynthesis